MDSQSKLENLIPYLKNIQSAINKLKLHEKSMNLDNKENNDWYFIFEKLIILRLLEHMEFIQPYNLDEIWNSVKNNFSNKLELLHEFENKINEFLTEKIGIDRNLVLNLNIPKDFNSNKNARENFFKILIESINEFIVDKNLIFEAKNDLYLLGLLYETYILRNEKETGSYYTPDLIIQHICKNTIEKQFERLFEELERMFENPNSDYKQYESLIKEFISIKILDPACGCGKFLLESLRILFIEYRRLYNLLGINKNKNSKNQEDYSLNLEQFPLFLIIRHIYGADSDQFAINIAKLSLWIQILMEFYNNSEKKELTNLKLITSSIFNQLKINIIAGNSLTGIFKQKQITLSIQNNNSTIVKLWASKNQLLKDPCDFSLYDNYYSLKTKLMNEIDQNHGIHWHYQFEDILYYKFGNKKLRDDLKEETDARGFDIIIGNPPYISSKDLKKKLKDLLKVKYSTAVNQFDIFTIFIELSYNLLKKGGLFGFIIPESYLGRSHFSSSRKFLLKNTIISEIDQISGVFEDPSVSNIILFFRKQSPTSSFIEFQNNSFDNYDDYNINFSRFEDLRHFQSRKGTSIMIPQHYFLENEKFRFLFISEKERKIIKKIRNDSIPLKEIIEIHRGEEIGRKSKIIQRKNSDLMEKIIFGKDIQQYQIQFNENFISKKDIGKKQNFPFYFEPKIVLRQLGDKINAAFDKKGEFVTLQTIYNIKITDKNYHYGFILALLNSDLMQFYYSLLFKEKKLFPRILLENIKNLPFKPANLDEQRLISPLVENLIDCKSSKRNPKSAEIENSINAFIFWHYSLNDEEICYILNYLEEDSDYQNNILKLVKNLNPIN